MGVGDKSLERGRLWGKKKKKTNGVEKGMRGC